MTDEPYDATRSTLPPGDPRLACRPATPRLARCTAPRPGLRPSATARRACPRPRPLSPRQERLYAALAHLSQVAGILVAPVMLLGSVGRESVFVDRHAKEAFNFQATFVLLFVASAVVALRGAGPTVIGVVAAYGMVMAGLAALRSWNGAFFRYPLAIRFLR